MSKVSIEVDNDWGINISAQVPVHSQGRMLETFDQVVAQVRRVLVSTLDASQEPPVELR